MIFSLSSTLKKILNLWPGKEKFGVYRFLPVAFAFGSAMEYTMIHLRIGEVNFCK